ncbi:MAG: AMP-binding protein [Gemmatimonadota bacterium]|nr:MAG: AMP-binding protein [Gemmatimonadota bacterium]
MSDFIWQPPPELTRNANITRFMKKYRLDDPESLLERSIAEQEWFWDAVVKDLGIEFSQPYDAVLDTSRGVPWTDWYVGGRLNVTANCLDRHLVGRRADEVCLVTEREDGLITRYTFRELAAAVDSCAAALVAAGIGAGDRVGAYMPMTAEVVIQLLGTLKIGAIFIPIFSGYAAAAVAERLRDARAKLLFTADSTVRRGRRVPIKENADAAVAEVPSVAQVVVVRQDADGVPWNVGRDVDWTDFLGREPAIATEMVASMEPGLILYTSGTTGRPKGTVHSHAGALVQIAKEVGYAFDMKPGDRFFWLTDIGWMMGPWMIVGGLFHGAAIVLYDGAFDWPEPDRLWEMLDRHRITVFGISPTAIRLAMRAGAEHVRRHDLSQLRILGSTGEPWDEASWLWYFEEVGGGRCPVINISGGTDIIGCFLSPLPIHPLKPCTLVGPGLGMAIDVWNEKGEPVRGEVGYLVATKPAPSMTRGLWNDPQRYLESYWSTWENVWNHGDWALIDEDGYWFLHGRADDTLKVAGRRIGPAEIEGALMATGTVSEAAAVGVPHEVKGEAIVCFVVLQPGHTPSEPLRQKLARAVVDRLGKIDRPDRVLFVTDLPKTRSAKILRRLVQKKYLGEQDLGDLSSVQNPEALDAIAAAQ